MEYGIALEIKLDKKKIIGWRSQSTWSRWNVSPGSNCSLGEYTANKEPRFIANFKFQSKAWPCSFPSPLASLISFEQHVSILCAPSLMAFLAQTWSYCMQWRSKCPFQDDVAFHRIPFNQLDGIYIPNNDQSRLETAVTFNQWPILLQVSEWLSILFCFAVTQSIQIELPFLTDHIQFWAGLAFDLIPEIEDNNIILTRDRGQ